MDNSSKTIMLVEDEQLLALMETRWLNRAGYKVNHVTSGESAVSTMLSNGNTIDLILMDINLGSGIDGTVAAQEILSRFDIPLLFLSSHTEKDIVEKTEKITSYGYVVKDNNDVVLLASIKMAFKLYDANKKLKEKEGALLKSQTRLRRAEFVSKSGNWEMNLNDLTMTASEGAGKIYGINGTVWDLKEIQKIPLSEYRPVLDKALHDLIQCSIPYDVEFKIKKGDSGEIVDIHSVAEYDKEKNTLFGIIQDITAKKQEEELLRESDEKNRLLLELAPDAFFRGDVDGNFILCNDKAAELTGFSKEELSRMNMRDLFPPSVLESKPLRYDLLLQGKTIKMERELLHKNGNSVPIEMSSKLMPDGTFQLFIRDISSRKKAEEELINTKIILEQAFEQSPVPMVLASMPDGIIRFANTACLEFLGMKDEPSPVGYSTMEINFPFKDYDTNWNLGTVEKLPLAKAMSGFKTSNEERIIVRKDNSIRWELVSGTPIYNGKGEIIAAYLIMNDITERKRIENALYASEKKYRDLFEESEDANLIIRDGRFIDCNMATVKMLGYVNKEEFLNTHPSELSPEFQPDGKSSFEKANEIMNLTIEKGSHRFEWAHKKANGDIFQVEVSLTAIDTGNEKIIYTTWRDVTERSKNEFALKQSEEKYRDLVEKMPDGVYKSSHEGKFLEINSALVKMLGYSSKEELYAIDIKNDLYFQPSDRESAALREKLEEMAIFRLKKKDGSEIWVEDHGRHVLDAEGNVLYHEGIMRDVTDRSKSELIQRALFDISEATYICTEIDDLYKKIHEVISTLLDVQNFYIALYDEEQEMISFPYFVDEFDPPQPPKKVSKGLTEYVLRKGESVLVNRAKFKELSQAGEVELVGSPSPIWLGVPLKVKGKTIGVIVVQDYKNESLYDESAMNIMNYVSTHIAQIIESKRNSDEIIKITEELKRLNRTKDKFFSIISHDLKNSFHIINSTTQLMFDDYDEFSKEEIIKFLKGIYNTSTKTYALFQNLLIWARAQSGNLDFIPIDFKLNMIVKQTLELIDENAALKNIHIENLVDDEIEVLADKNMLETIIRNLITNSIKFTNDGGNIKIGAKANADSTEIYVEDNGIGIPAEEIDKMFRIDQSYSTLGTRKETGSGLGLILCREFVKKHGGNIWVESQVGKGSKISFTINKK